MTVSPSQVSNQGGCYDILDREGPEPEFLSQEVCMRSTWAGGHAVSFDRQPEAATPLLQVFAPYLTFPASPPLNPLFNLQPPPPISTWSPHSS